MVVTFVLEAGLPTEVLGSRSSRDGASRATWRVSAIAGGDTKVVEHGKADGMYISTTGIGRLLRASRFRRSRCVPATRFCSPARSAITALRSCWRAENWTWKPNFARTLAQFFLWSRRWFVKPDAGSPLDARSDARRRGDVPE